MIVRRIAERLFPAERRTRRLALVSCLPPEQSGIADFTHELLAASGELLQAYAAPGARRAYLEWQRYDGVRQSVVPLDRLEHDMRKDVDAAVLMVGNSPHFADLLEWAAAVQRRSPNAPLLLYAHDAFLQSVLLLLSRRDDLMTEMRRDHGRALRVPSSAAELAELLEQRVLGASVIVKWLRPSMVIVNSATSRALLQQEPGWPQDTLVETAFQPVVPARARWTRGAQGKPLRIGAFGMPNLFKKLDVTFEAHALLRRDQPDTTLVLAGYGMDRYVAERGWSGRPGVEVYDSPGEEELGSLMAGVDVAVQLRNADLGESSGVIARLLAIGTPIIASPLGASLELGEAVAFTSLAPGAEELTNIILREVAHPGHRKDHVAQYIQGRTFRDLGFRIAQLAAEARAPFNERKTPN
jgi:hypothetical protein